MIRYFLLFFLIAFLAVSAAVHFAWQSFISPGHLSQETTVVIPRGSSFDNTIHLLVKNKILIIHPLIVKIAAYINGDAGRIKAGEYLFPARVSAQSALGILVEGKSIIHKVTVAEGLNVREVLSLLRSNTVLSGDIPENVEEGILLPETYHFHRGDSRSSLIERMQNKMRHTLDALWKNRAEGLPLKSKQEALILASIVEKETGVKAERARVAAVFINRLRIKMKLQSDPTTVYGLEKAIGKPLERPLTFADLKQPTPYNTYIIAALPPTPIANPGKAAIEAVLHPLETDELYFVATGEGGHHFAKTLVEHNKNVRAYRKKMKNR